MPSEEEVYRLRCHGEASLEMEAKTVEVFSPKYLSSISSGFIHSAAIYRAPTMCLELFWDP